MPVSRLDRISSETVEHRLLEALRDHPSGLRKDQIRQRIVATGAMVDLSVVARQLREFQKQGIVDFKNQRWMLKHPQPADKPAPATKPAKRRPPRSGSPESKGFPTAASSTAADEFVACLPLHAYTADAQQPSNPTALGNGLPLGLSLLRRLIPYWRESLRAEERPSTILPLERANMEFCGLTTADPWWPTEQRSAELTIAADHLPAELLATLARRGTESDIFIGYPLQLIPGTGDRAAFARPIFTFTCGLEMTAGTLKLTLPPQPIDINAGWLEKQFRDPMERRAVLCCAGSASSVRWSRRTTRKPKRRENPWTCPPRRFG